MRWAKRQRMEFIEGCLRARGRINRSDIRHKFGVSEPQASADLKAFQAEYPGVMRYDMSKKYFVLAASLPTGNPRDTTAAANVLMRADDAWLKEVANRDPGMIRDVAAALIYERSS